MKKTLALVLALVLVLSLAACGSSAKAPTSSPSASTSAPETPTADEPVTEEPTVEEPATEEPTDEASDENEASGETVDLLTSMIYTYTNEDGATAEIRTTYTYNEYGDKILEELESDGETQTTYYFYDEAGNLVKSMNVYSIVDGPRGTEIIEYEYYPSGALKSTQEIQTHDGIKSDGKEVSYTYEKACEYGEAGNLLSEIISSYGDIMNYDDWKEYIYDSNNNLITIKMEDFIDTKIYDNAGNCIERTSYRPSTQEEWTTYYTYDSENRLIREEEYVEEGTYLYWEYEYTYDADGNCLNEHFVQHNRGDYIIKDYIKDTTWTYDHEGRMLTETYITSDSPDPQHEKTYEYNAHGDCVLERTTYDDGYTFSYSHSFEYDNHGNMVKDTENYTSSDISKTRVTTYTYQTVTLAAK